jgi:quercetin dioxygenase-like cupin family protein
MDGAMNAVSVLLLYFTGLFFQGAPHDATKPVIDNERVTVWDVTWVKGKPGPMQKHQNDFLTVYLTGGAIKTTLPDGTSSVANHKTGEAIFEKKGSTHREEGVGENPAHTVVIDLKDHPVAPLANKSGYPNAFPREGSKKVLENDRVIVWDYTWLPGRPTPMHFHNTDVVVMYTEDGTLKSTTPDGQSVLNEYTPGIIKFNLRDRIHTEELVKGKAHAMMMELK